ncbi:hypothetical protein LV155_006703 [Aspergillus fumigatus]|nr:hypothetical protein KXV34_006672 [Aspergillus fumigatus]KAJ8152573.1 hypothetical protein LV155_006703 [Aspergillus fumigatus]
MVNNHRQNIYIKDGMVTFVTVYHKGFHASNNVKIIHRYVPREVGELVAAQAAQAVQGSQIMQGSQPAQGSQAAQGRQAAQGSQAAQGRQAAHRSRAAQGNQAMQAWL